MGSAHGASMPSPTPLPPWDALFADPSAFDGLPPQMQNALYEQVAVMEARIRARVLARHQRVVQPDAGPDRAVRIDEALLLLGMTRDYLYRHWKKLGGYRDDDGHVKFALSTIRRHISRAARRSTAS